MSTSPAKSPEAAEGDDASGVDRPMAGSGPLSNAAIRPMTGIRRMGHPPLVRYASMVIRHSRLHRDMTAVGRGMVLAPAPGHDVVCPGWHPRVQGRVPVCWAYHTMRFCVWPPPDRE